jgi:hypothetical protein
VSQDRDPSPSVASVDSQTVPTAVMVGESVGYDAGKKAKGRKRFTLVDKIGLRLMVKFVAADIQERDGAKQLLAQMNQERHRVPRLVRKHSNLSTQSGHDRIVSPGELDWYDCLDDE